jgi:hypothetical protein
MDQSGWPVRANACRRKARNPVGNRNPLIAYGFHPSPAESSVGASEGEHVQIMRKNRARPGKHGRTSRTVAATGAAALAISGGALALAPVASQASSHREAPLISGDPRADNTDVYAFVSPDKTSTVTLLANWIPFEEPNGGPNFYPFAQNTHYLLHIDNNGDGVSDINYIWTFTNHYRDAKGQFLYNTGVVKSVRDKTLNFYQTYTLQREDRRSGPKTILKNAVVAPSDTGKASMPNYAALVKQATKGLPGGGKTFAGQADDPFFLDLRVFDLLYGGNLSEAGHDTLKGYNVNTLGLQVPKSELAYKGDASRNPVIGVWSSTAERTVKVTAKGVTKLGPYVQVSRLGNPLVNEAVVPLAYKDAFNAIPPSVDHTVTPVVKAVLNPIVPQLIQKIYGIPAPQGPRNDLAEIFLTGIAKNAPTLDGTKAPIQADLNSQVLNADVNPAKFLPSEELRLNMAVPVTAKPNRLGVLGGDFQGFPNGRRLGDDVIDIALQALEGAATNGIVKPLAAGDGVNANEHAFSRTFPYVALPNTAAVNQAK